jgi:hypothetical protein
MLSLRPRYRLINPVHQDCAFAGNIAFARGSGIAGELFGKENEMQKKLAGAMGVISAVAALDCAQAAAPGATNVSDFLKPQSFAELLEPVPNPLALLKEVDKTQAAQRKANPQLAQYFYDHHHHSHFQPAWGAPVFEERAGYERRGDFAGASSAHERRLQIIWCTQHPGRC